MITRSEAIAILKGRMDNLLENSLSKEAFKLAIASLETDEAYQLEYERTTKNDLGVDREDAVERLNALKQFIGYDKDSEIVKATQKSLDMAIKALEQEPRWIPASERLPEKTGIYLISIGDLVASKSFDGHNFRTESAVRFIPDAWMPLPEPFEPQESEG